MINIRAASTGQFAIAASWGFLSYPYTNEYKERRLMKPYLE